MISLNFLLDRTERTFNLYLDQHNTFGLDRFTWAAFFTLALMYDISMFTTYSSDGVGYACLIMYNVLLLCQGYCLYCRPSTYQTHRRKVLTAAWVTYTGITLVGIQHLPPLQPPNSTNVFLRLTFLGSGACAMAWYGIGMSTSFSLQVMLQPVAFIAAGLVNNWNLSSVLVSTALGQDLVKTIWSNLDQFYTTLITGCHGMPCLTRELPVQQQANAIIMQLQLVLGTMLPLCIVYAVEMRSRVVFLHRY